MDKRSHRRDGLVFGVKDCLLSSGQGLETRRSLAANNPEGEASLLWFEESVDTICWSTSAIENCRGSEEDIEDERNSPCEEVESKEYL